MGADEHAERCFHLRTKAMYIAGLSAEAFGEAENEPVCWCNRTLRELGPDGEPADRVACSEPARSCFRLPGT